MEAVKVVEFPDKLMKHDFMSYLKGEKSKQLIDQLWPFIKMDPDGRILYMGEDGEQIPGSPLVDLIEYTTADDRASIDRPFDIKKFWSILATNNIVASDNKKWKKL